MNGPVPPGGLSREAVMWCDRIACLSAFPRQRAAKSNANSQGSQTSSLSHPIPPAAPLQGHTATWKQPLFHGPTRSHCSIHDSAYLSSAHPHPTHTHTHTHTRITHTTSLGTLGLYTGGGPANLCCRSFPLSFNPPSCLPSLFCP